MQTVGNLKDSVAGLLSGTNLDNVTNLDGAITRAVRTVIQQADVPDVMETQSLTLYDRVYNYPAPSNIFGGALVDIRPQSAVRDFTDYVYKKYITEFDRQKHMLPNGYSVAFEHNKGVGIMRVASPKPTPAVILDQCTATTGWTASGDATGLAQDKTVYYDDPASLRFNLSASGSNGYIEKTITAQDLTEYEGVGVVFVACRLPSATAITSIGVRLGSSSANYFNVSDTEGFLGAWKTGEWTILALDLSTASETGTVDIEAVDYIRVYVNYDGTALTNFYVGSIWVALPSPHEVVYYSSAVFLASGALSKTIGDDNDEIVFNDAAYTLLEYETALQILLQNGGSISEGLGQTYSAILYGSGTNLGLYAMYRADNPSQEVRTVGNWYLD
jgi:hypothetical protein